MGNLNISVVGPTTKDFFLKPRTPERHSAASQAITDYASFEGEFNAADPDEKVYALGGQAFNTAEQLAGQRYRLAVATILGSLDDPFVSAALQAYQGMEASLTTFESEQMGMCGYLIGPRGSSKSWYKPPVSSGFSKESFLKYFSQSLHFTDLLYLPAACPEIALAAVQAVERDNVFVVYAPGKTLEEDTLDHFEEILSRTNILVVNEYEARRVLARYEDANNLDDLFKANPDLNLVVQTLGIGGSSFYLSGSDYNYPMPGRYKVTAPKSTAGAGDAFTAVLGVKCYDQFDQAPTERELEDIADSAHAAASRVLGLVSASRGILDANGQIIKGIDDNQQGAA